MNIKTIGLISTIVLTVSAPAISSFTQPINNYTIINDVNASQRNCGDYAVKVVTQGNNLNCRSGPGTNYSIVGKFKNGTIISYHYMDPNYKPGWAYVFGVGIDGKQISGYVSEQYLQNCN